MNTSGEPYYREKLAGERLKACYALAPPRVQQYLPAEVEHLLGQVTRDDAVLELGCGAGRVLEPLVAAARRVVGIDTSAASLALAKATLGSRCTVFEMDATSLEFPDDTFDVVACVQNGISAFHCDRVQLLREALRVTRPGGRALFSSYSSSFWESRLAWFRLQAKAGLIGPIDEEASGDGVIVGGDGFRAETVSEAEFRALAIEAVPEADCTVMEVDGSSLFCCLVKLGPARV